MDPRIARIQDRQKAQTAATRLAVTPIVAASDAATEATVVALFDAFGVGKAYRVGDVCSHGGKVYRYRLGISRLRLDPDPFKSLSRTPVGML